MRLNFVAITLAVFSVSCGSDQPDGMKSIDAYDPPAIDAAPPVIVDAPVSYEDGGFGLPDGLPDLGDASLACSLSEIQPILECAVDNNCLSDPNPTVCVTTSCALEFLSLSPECGTCVLTGLLGTTSDIISACTGITIPSP